MPTLSRAPPTETLVVEDVSREVGVQPATLGVRVDRRCFQNVCRPVDIDRATFGHDSMSPFGIRIHNGQVRCTVMIDDV